MVLGLTARYHARQEVFQQAAKHGTLSRAPKLLDFRGELPGDGGAVEVVLLPWCGGAPGAADTSLAIAPGDVV
jgi:hypothetical protein